MQDSKYLAHKVTTEKRADGSILYSTDYPLGKVAKNTGEWLHKWAQQSPSKVFLAERSGAGWREEAYQGALDKVRAIGAALLARGLNATTPILIMSGNGVDHGLLSLAAQYVGVPTVPVAEQYSLIHGAHGRLQHVIELVRPAMAYVVDADQYSEALKLDALKGIEIVATSPGNQKVTSFADLLKGDSSVDLDAAYGAVGPDTVAKILMTSGSTSSPKGVLITQEMLCVNQAQIADIMPLLGRKPPRIVDWLPWNHVFGGNHNFNMMLANGGSLYIDDGKPVKALFGRTLENLSMICGTLVFNVPAGFSMLLEGLRGDKDLRQRFFEDLDMVFYAGASLPQDVWEGFEEMAMEISGSMPLITSSWGLTETAPAALMQHEPTDRSGIVGVPVTGMTAKLIPDDEMRCEIRVKGPNIMPGYFENPEKTAESFDDEGYFITGDAMKFVDPDDPSKGLMFDGRISEDFKLLTGTWVRAGGLRMEMLTCLGSIASDLVITGHDKNEIGVLIFPNMDEIKKAGFKTHEDGGALVCDLLLSDILHRLNERAGRTSGSSTRVARALVLAAPPSIADAEITAKGNINFRKVLTLRSGLLERLYNDDDPATVNI